MRQQPTKPSSEYEFADIPISLIDYNVQQVREVQVDDEIHELASSIQAHTMLQLPGVIPSDNGRYLLAWGRRRLEAHKLARKTHITCRIFRGSMDQVKTLALTENLQRRSMSVKEECAGVTHLYESEGLSVDQIVTRLGRTRHWVNLRLALPNFRPDVREACLAGNLSLGAAEVIELCTDDTARAYILSQAIDQRLSIPTVRKMVEAVKESPPQHEAIQAGLDAARTPVATQPLQMVCAACNRPRPLDSLIFVRVCNDGCPDEAPTPPTAIPPAPQPVPIPLIEEDTPHVS